MRIGWIFMKILKGNIQESESGCVNQDNQVQMDQESGSLSGACFL